ncbi:MAG: MFS transporter [Actinomycetales bacterium]|nr:MFS transporter [Actinomycetales bacterium]
MAVVTADAPGPKGAAYRLVTVALVLLTTMIAFENMAVTTAMPLAAAELGAVASYGLAFSAMMTAMLLGIVLAGAWADRSGTLPAMFSGQALFVVGTAACAAAPTFGLLLIGRAVTGLGAGLITVVEFVAVGRVYPPSLRPRVFTWLSAAWILPSLVGAPLAGWLAASLSWRWVFWAVLPPALVAVALVAVRRNSFGSARRAAGTTGVAGSDAELADPEATPIERAEHRRLARLGGAVALSAGVVQLAIHERPPVLSALAALGVVGLGGVIISAPRLLPAGTFRGVRGLPSVIASRGLLNGSFIGGISFVPLMLNRERGIDLTSAGIVLALASLGWSAGSWWQGRSRLRGPIERARLVVVGAALVALGIAGLAPLAAWPTAPIPLFAVTLAVAGLGMGAGSTTLSVLVLDLSPQQEHGRASAALQLSDVLGSVIAAAAATAIFGAVHRDGAATAYVLIWGALAAVGALGVLTGARCAPASASDNVATARG